MRLPARFLARPPARLIAPALMLAAAACGDGGGAAGGGEKASSAPKVDPARLIAGEVRAPEGVDLTGAKALACLTPQETCAQEAEAPVTIADGVGRFELIVPVAGDYHVMVWKDVDGDGSPNPGDLVAFAHNMDPVASGQRLTAMTALVKSDRETETNLGGEPMGSPAELQAAAAAVRAANLTGRWSQSSTGTELVWGPEIKFQAASATVGFGTNLGGTFGAGSPTNTTIVYSYKPMQVSRSMTLDIRPDGAFHWTATQQRRQGKCRDVRQEKFGRVVVTGDQLTFVVVDARQSCGGGAPERLEAKPETFTLSRQGQAFRLTADKGVNWTFNPAG